MFKNPKIEFSRFEDRVEAHVRKKFTMDLGAKFFSVAFKYPGFTAATATIPFEWNVNMPEKMFFEEMKVTGNTSLGANYNFVDTTGRKYERNGLTGRASRKLKRVLSKEEWRKCIGDRGVVPINYVPALFVYQDLLDTIEENNKSLSSDLIHPEVEGALGQVAILLNQFKTRFEHEYSQVACLESLKAEVQ